MVKVNIISVGDELLIGQVINSNASYLGELLTAEGFDVEKIVTIGDDRDQLIKQLNESVNSSDLVIITGGLGPTHDDITKNVLVDFTEDSLILNTEILENVRKFFEVRNIKMPEINIGQAEVPSKAKIIWNSKGTAPGLWLEKEECVIISLPGVPYEMKNMMEKYVIDMLRNKYKNKFTDFYLSKTILTTGIGESLLSEMLGNINELILDSKLAFLPSAYGVRLRIGVTASDLRLAEEKINTITKRILNIIEPYVYGFGNISLEEVVMNLFIKHKKTLSVAESCTGGLISNRITNVSGSSKYFLGSINSYSNQSKINILGVNSSTIEKFGAVSKETALEMAKNVRKLFKSDIAVSTTGIAGPLGGSTEKPIGLTYIGYSDSEESFAEKFTFGSDREINKIRASQAALNILRKKLNRF